MATYYVDYATGANNTYTALTSCVASNPSGTITRITKTAHGLANGNIVVLSGFSAWLNTQWTVTNSNPNYFDLQGAVWQTTAITSGTVTRTWGRQWSEPLDFIYRITSTSAGDTFKIAKTPDPVSIGNATWTNKSITVTLANAQTTLIDDVDSGWTANASGDVTITYDTTNKKSGTGRGVFTFDSTPQTNIKQAYKTLGAALNLSSYNSITFWLTNSVAIADANRLKIALCSDTTGDTIVDEFYIPQVAHTGGVISLNLTRNGGGSLGTNINSIALYSMGAAVTASSNYTLDNINACNSNGLHLNTLISKSSTAWNYNEVWCPIKSINGTTITIDSSFINYTMTLGNTLRGYYTTGASSETVTTYIMNPYQPAMIRASNSSSQSSNSMHDYYNGNASGTLGNVINFIGGWNKNTDTRDGMTWVNMRSSGSAFYHGIYDYTEISYFGVMRGYYAIEPDSPSGSGTTAVYKAISYCTTVGCQWGSFIIGFSAGFSKPTVYNVVSNNNTYPFYSNGLATGSSINNLKMVSNDAVAYNVGGPLIPFNNTAIYNAGLTDATFRKLYTFYWFVPGTQPIPIYTGLDVRDCVGPIFSVSNLNGDGIISQGIMCPYIDNSTFINNTTVFQGSSFTDYYYKNTLVTNSTFTTNTNLFTNVLAPNFRFYNCSIDNATKNAQYQTIYEYTSYDRLNGSNYDFRSYWYYGNVLMQSGTTHSGTGYAWQINPTLSSASVNNPFRIKIASVAVNSGSLVTFKCWVKKTHATNIGARLVIPGRIIPGVSNDISTTKADDTNWEQLTITFTPSAPAVTDICIESWNTASPYTNSVYVDEITLTQV